MAQIQEADASGGSSTRLPSGSEKVKAVSAPSLTQSDGPELDDFESDDVSQPSGFSFLQIMDGKSGRSFGAVSEPMTLNLSNPFARPLDLKFLPDFERQESNPALAAWHNSKMTDGSAFAKSSFEKANVAQMHIDDVLSRMSVSERQQWRRFQIQLSKADTNQEAHAIRQKRNKAFPDLASAIDQERDHLEAGKHAETDTRLLFAFPQGRDTNHFTQFLKTAGLETKEGLVDMLDRAPMGSRDLFSTRRNRLNYYNSDPGRAMLYYGDSRANSFRAPGNSIDRLRFDRSLPSSFSPELGTAGGDTSSLFSLSKSPQQYAQQLARTIQSAQELEASRLSSSQPGFDILRTLNVAPEDLRPLTPERKTDSLKASLEKSLLKLDNPGKEQQLALKLERLDERLNEVFSKPEFNDLVDKEKLEKSLLTLRTSKYATTEEKLEFVDSLGRLTNANFEGVAPLKDRYILAGQMIDQFANRRSIDQGGFGTCAMAVVEKLIYAHSLSTVGRMVTDVALTGRTTDAGGKEIKIDRESLVGGSDVRRMVPPTDDVRSLASQYVTLIAANARFQIQNEANKTQWRYAHENGRDVIKDDSTNPPGNVYRHVQTGKFLTVPPSDRAPVGYFAEEDPNVTNVTTILDTYEKMTGKSAVGLAIHAGETRKTDPRVISVTSKQELDDQLMQREAEDYPIILNQPGHVATVDGFNRSTGLVDYDNQWGDKNDRLGTNGITSGELFDIAESGFYSFDYVDSNELASDDLETLRDLNLVSYSTSALEHHLATMRFDPSKADASWTIAKELKLRADQSLSKSSLAHEVSALPVAQNLLRGKSVSAEGKPIEIDNPLPLRVQIYTSISGTFGQLSQRIDTRKTLGELAPGSGRTEEAEKNFIEAVLLADAFPMDILESQRLLVASEMSKPETPTSTKLWFAEFEKSIGNPKELPTDRGLVHQPLMRRLDLLKFYCGPNGMKPAKAAAVADEIRDIYKEMTGVDVMTWPVQTPDAKRTTEDTSIDNFRLKLALIVRGAHMLNAKLGDSMENGR